MAEESSGPGAPMWLATYTDTITLLMTFFVLLMTFSTTSPFKSLRKDSSAVGGKYGSGAAGKDDKGPDLAAVVIRDFTNIPAQGPMKSEVRPDFSDETIPTTGRLLQVLKEEPLGTLADSYRLSLPISVLVNRDQRVLSVSGHVILNRLAKNVRNLPYDIRVAVPRSNDIDAAFRVCDHLYRVGRIHPGRLGVFLEDGGNLPANTIRIEFVRAVGR